jgi:hypothetical protein
MKRSRLVTGKKAGVWVRLKGLSRRDLAILGIPLAAGAPILFVAPEMLPVVAAAESALASGLMLHPNKEPASKGRDKK